MSEMTVSHSAAAARSLKDLVFATVVVVAALFILYLVLVNQTTYLHEFNHDGRHLFAASCH